MCAGLVREKKLAADPFEGLEPLKDTRVTADSPVIAAPGAPVLFEDVAQFKAAAGAADPFKPGETYAILQQARGPVLNMLTFWFMTGLRTGELLALQWQDIVGAAGPAGVGSWSFNASRA
jgi:integrase